MSCELGKTVLFVAQRRRCRVDADRFSVIKVCITHTHTHLHPYTQHIAYTASQQRANVSRDGFNGRPLVQWPTRLLGGWALEGPGPRGPGRLILACNCKVMTGTWIEFMIYLNLKRVRWFGVLFFQNFNKEISYFLTDLLQCKLPQRGSGAEPSLNRIWQRRP